LVCLATVGAAALTPFAQSTHALANGTNAASYAVYGQPTSLAAGGSATFSVTLRNAGSSTWQPGGTFPFHLRIAFAAPGGTSVPSSTLFTDQGYALPASVVPDQSVTLQVTISAPATAGNDILIYQMVEEGIAFFPQYADTAVSVSGSGPVPPSALASSYRVSGQPAIFSPGGSAAYYVTVTNTGSGTWQSGGSYPIHLRIAFAAPGSTSVPGGALFTDQGYALPTNIAPGQSATLQVTVQAPAIAGNDVLIYQMVEEGIAFFPQYADDPASVASSGPASGSCVSASTEQACMSLMLSIVNGDRANAGLPPYSLNQTESMGTGSCVGSYGHSVHMSQVGSISHDQFPADICVPFQMAGENVGMDGSANEASNLQALDSLMMGEPHDAYTCAHTVNHACNILSSAYHQIGIGIYYASNGTWLTEDFTD